ncbi:MAG: DUF4111 domain-containing protein [Chloroflexi bacterium]|nr:DUF4111 domain-containing protein [Chloroflexota bacterium]MCC6891932.1 DUF4111 domain-containing protein [Anaerolineae bacterium]
MGKVSTDAQKCVILMGMENISQLTVQALVRELLTGMQRILGGKLVGVYVFGSLVMGDFDETVSDIDLLAALESDLNPTDFAALDQLHNEWAAAHPEWAGRLEIAYLSRHGLQTFRNESTPMGIISPGEPFHMIEAGHDWLINWYVVRNNGLTIYGAPVEDVIAPISMDEFIDNVKIYVDGWRQRFDEFDRRPSQAYAILTMCRALYTVTHGQQISKVKAAAWAAEQYPQWAELINNAVQWRLAWREEADGALTRDAARRFTAFAIKTILG